MASLKPIILFAMLILPTPALAYLGPALGLGIIGSVIAILGIILLSGFSFIYLPVRDWIARRRNNRDGNTDRQD